MNTHTPKQMIDMALVARGGLPVMCSCPHCGETQLDREDMATVQQFGSLFLSQVEEIVGGLPCTGCADEFVACIDCGDAVECGPLTSHNDGFACLACRPVPVEA